MNMDKKIPQTYTDEHRQKKEKKDRIMGFTEKIIREN